MSRDYAEAVNRILRNARPAFEACRVHLEDEADEPEGAAEEGDSPQAESGGGGTSADPETKARETRLAGGAPERSGLLRLRWRIGPEGRAHGVHILENTFASGLFGRCVVKRLYELRFPRPKHRGFIPVRFPIAF